MGERILTGIPGAAVSSTSRLNILVVSAYYWPESAGSAPYVTDLVEYLARKGHGVTVVTAFPHYPAWRSTAGWRFATAETHRNVPIRRRRVYVPSHQSLGHRALYEASFLLSGSTGLRLRPPPDLVLGTSPTLSAAWLAAAAAKAYGVPYGLVFQDLIGLAAEQAGVRGGTRVARLLRAAEHRVAGNAGAVMIAAEGFRPYFAQGGVEPAKIARLRNWVRRVEPAPQDLVTRAELGWRDDEFICLHGGNLGLKQGLDNLVAAAAMLDGSGVRIVFAGDGSERARLESEASRLQLRNVSFLLSPRPGRFEALLELADLALVNQRASVTDMSLPSKLTSYFAAGRPIIAAVSPGSETGREIENANAGLVVPPGDPEALSSAILAAKDIRPELEVLGANGLRFARANLQRDLILAELEQRLLELCGRVPAIEQERAEVLETVGEPIFVTRTPADPAAERIGE